tara:strand:+ start:219 stop:2381 length:2163 start_codon:yes stop_codon:yes gene_type:complete
MSINKILNRPLFRKEALKKGHLKPISKQLGGEIRALPSPFFGPPKPTLGQNIMRSLPVRAVTGLGRGLMNPVILGGYAGGKKVADAFAIENPLTREGIGLAGSIGATRLPGAAAIGSMGMGPQAGILAALGLGYMGMKDQQRFDALTPQQQAAERAEQENFARSVESDGGISPNIFTRAKPKPNIFQQNKNITEVRPEGGGRGKKPSQVNVDVATEPQNTTEVAGTKKIDTAKIAENAMEFPNPQLNLPVAEEKKEEFNPLQPGKQKEDSPKGAGRGLQADLDALQKDSPFMQQLDVAKQIAKEMRGGRTSNSNLIFLSNLASGLLTGTTRKSGLGGAVEVFGKALGPAVNNMVMVKMKEDEINQNLLGRAMEFTTDFLKAQNDAYELPDTDEVGVIQRTNADGELVNVAGRRLKDGTLQINTGQIGRNGRNIFVTVPGRDVNFIADKDKNKDTLELAGDLAGKYAALNLINRSLGIILEEKADAGVGGAIQLYGGRLTRALGDVFDFVKPSGNNRAELNRSGRAIFELERDKAARRLVNAGEYETKDEAKRFLDKTFGNYNKIKTNYFNEAKRRLEGGKSLDYERLAINETVLVYKLANSLKSKDRLTQKDIEMAKNLVRVFPFLRGETDVTASLQATAETILDDIKQNERMYLKAGGASSYLENERRAYGLDTRPFQGDSQIDVRAKELQDLTEEELEQKFNIVTPLVGQTGRGTQRG